MAGPTVPIVEIVDADDPRVDDYRRLNDQAARREMERDEFFIAEGYVSIDRAIDSGHRLRSVLLAPSRLNRFEPHRERLAADGVPLFVADRSVIASVVGFDLHRGVLASAHRKPHPSMVEVAANAKRLVVLEGLNDPENVGAISRAARAFGFDAMVLSPNCTDPYTRRTVRVSMGEVLHLRVARSSDWPADLGVLHEHGVTTWAMTPAADAVGLWDAVHETGERIAVVLGAEGPGLDAATMQTCSQRVRIPISPDVDSLNVGHAAAVTFAALTRP